MTAPVEKSRLVEMLEDSRARTLELVAGLDEAQLMGPKLPTVNPLRWEIGHIAYFYEYFILRALDRRASILGDRADAVYDSISVAHDTRWDLPLLTMDETLRYMEDTKAALIDRLDEGEANERDSFITQFGVFHEDMHTEAFLWGRQTLGYPMPALALAADVSAERSAGPRPGFVDVPGGTFTLGAAPDAPFLFDNEKWGHAQEVRPFSIARAPVTNAEFAAFVEQGGYERDEFWSPEGRAWKTERELAHPGYWMRADGGEWQVRHFDRTLPLAPHAPVIHVTWYEAEAYCRFAGGRLPTELEWEVAALGEPAADGSLAPDKRRYPWGSSAPDPTRANLDGRALGTVDVAAHAAGDSAFGCRQMMGNVWEWCADTFDAFPGFSPDAYQDYSAPLFGTTKVLRGGAWPTRGRVVHGTYRNYFEPDRWNVFAGFRMCR